MDVDQATELDLINVIDDDRRFHDAAYCWRSTQRSVHATRRCRARTRR